MIRRRILKDVLIFPRAPETIGNADGADDKEGDAQNLPFAQTADVFCNLILFEIFDAKPHAEIEHENERRRKTERTGFAAFLIIVVHAKHGDAGDDAHADFEELRRITRDGVVTRENEGNRRVGIARRADDLGVKEIPETDADHGKGNAESEAVDGNAQRRMSPETIVDDADEHHPRGRAVASESAAPEIEHFDGIIEIALGFVKKAVNEARADDDGSDEGIGEVCRAFGIFVLILVTPAQGIVTNSQSEGEEYAVISQMDGIPDIEENGIHIPDDESERG